MFIVSSCKSKAEQYREAYLEEKAKEDAKKGDVDVKKPEDVEKKDVEKKDAAETTPPVKELTKEEAMNAQPELDYVKKYLENTDDKAIDKLFDSPRIAINTKYGNIVIAFFKNAAPKHVDNFIKLSKEGFYDKTIFHRVIPGFMIQGGDPNTKDPSKVAMYGTGGPGTTVPAEFNKIPHDRGILSMARSADPNSAGSQFFLMHQKYPSLDNQYSVFGAIIKGIDVVDKVVNLPRNERDLPNERVEMTMKVYEK